MTAEERVLRAISSVPVGTPIGSIKLSAITDEIRAAVAEEREACAKIADLGLKHFEDVRGWVAAREIAAAIRART
jgi:hypothetical protein